MNSLQALVLSAVVVATSSAQTVEFGGVSSGIVFHPAHGLRQLTGVPGSAILAQPMLTDLDSAWPSPNGTHSVVLRSGRTELLAGLASGAITVVSNIDLIESPSQVVWNTAGTAALLYSKEQGILQCAGLEYAKPPQPIQFIEGEVSALALADCSAIAISKGNAVYLLAEGLGPQQISGSAARGIAFADGHTLYIASESTVIRYSAKDADIKTVHSGESYAAVRVTDTGKIVVLAEGRALVLNASGEELQTVPVTSASRFQALRPSLFLLSSPAEKSSPVTVLDVSKDPLVFFIPSSLENTL